ncbi:MAG: hypothetical protein RMI51_00090 [Aquificaceae bacterium]|nr:hypothetical protein [Aquificaceae bacterium]
MKIQKLFKSIPNKPENMEPFISWQELTPEFEYKHLGDCYLMVAELKEQDFDKLLSIFQSREEAIGAFLSVAMEHHWEVVPETYCVYHAHEENGRLIAGILFENTVSTYEQTTLEQMVHVLARVHRIVVYSYDVVTYIKDIYPDVDYKVYSIARELAKRSKRVPELTELARIYCVPLESLEDKLKLINRLLENPIRTGYEDVELPPFSYPLTECGY